MSICFELTVPGFISYYVISEIPVPDPFVMKHRWDTLNIVMVAVRLNVGVMFRHVKSVNCPKDTFSVK